MAFEKKQDIASAKEKDFSSYPASCLCGAETAVAVVTVTNLNTGQTMTSSASEFTGRDDNNRPNGILQDWWKLSSYRGYCVDCYAGIKKPGKRKYTDKQVRYAWQWMLGEICSDGDNRAMAGTFKRMNLTNSQRDTAIEIVNYEAMRTNQPDSIPDELKLSEVWGI